jgi:hypothetical protein
VAMDGDHRGEYMIGCAADYCGYRSKSILFTKYMSVTMTASGVVPIDRLWSLRGVLVQRYSIHGMFKFVRIDSI